MEKNQVGSIAFAFIDMRMNTFDSETATSGVNVKYPGRDVLFF
jgi:hypothetical protein